MSGPQDRLLATVAGRLETPRMMDPWMEAFAAWIRHDTQTCMSVDIHGLFMFSCIIPWGKTTRQAPRPGLPWALCVSLFIAGITLTGCRDSPDHITVALSFETARELDGAEPTTGCGQQLYGTASVFLVGMRSPYYPSLAAIPRSFPRSLPVRLPAWRACHERSFASTTSLSSDDSNNAPFPILPFRFETGIGLFAKRQPRPFPPPFLSPPSMSFSDALSTHHRSRDRRAFVNGDVIRGQTNGDDAVYASDFFICANDGVGAWATRPRGHAGLWSRLILHFWSAAIEEEMLRVLSSEQPRDPDPVACLQTAYEQTLEATVTHDCLGTTTACGAQLHYKFDPNDTARTNPSPLLYVTNLGDCRVMVLRPRAEQVVYKTTEQWHWFDCPRQLGTNSPDTPNDNAVMDKVDLEVGDVVLAMSDGVTDNLWEHEIVSTVLQSIQKWEAGSGAETDGDRTGGRNGGMIAAAQDLVAAAKEIAVDPFAESPFMEHAIEEGLASEGGKLDDISVVAALCKFILQHHCRLRLATSDPLRSTFPFPPGTVHDSTMRGKRSKQYRKLMEQFSMTFGFREPYQILVDAEMVKDSCRFKMDLAPALSRTVHGEVKPMITQCEIRKLYAQNREPGVAEAIELAKTLERRRCGHHPDQYPEPLSTEACMRSVIDPKETNQNKHRYVVASQGQDVRRMLRGVKGVPLIYIKRSVMILEPMANDSVQVRQREERGKFRAELKKPAGKRKRDDDDDDTDEDKKQPEKSKAVQSEEQKKKKAKGYGPKGANPLSQKSKKKQQDKPQVAGNAAKKEGESAKKEAEQKDGEQNEGGQDAPAKRKRRRRNKYPATPAVDGQDGATPEVTTTTATADS
ncbi:hypothetical protein G7046_g6142 [Stylonectria norvegica]|nr:hypothetical protein G7046_g6142 [Stylonectria norvegica]